MYIYIYINIFELLINTIIITYFLVGMHSLREKILDRICDLRKDDVLTDFTIVNKDSTYKVSYYNK